MPKEAVNKSDYRMAHGAPHVNWFSRSVGIRLHLLNKFSCLLWLLTLTHCLGCGASDSNQIPSSRMTPESTPEWVADEEPQSETELPNPFQAPEAENSPPPLQAESPPQKIFRPDDTRAIPNEADLAEFGIRKFESKRLILYTDADPEIAATLPPVVDQAYEALVDYFGELPPARSGADFQMTGYLIDDRDLILSAGLIPPDLNRFDHGQHRRQEFWMNEQEKDYYRRHLLIHEVTHCFTMIMPGMRPPLWYLEGVAELFATHRTNDSGKVEFGVMPEESQEYRGFGRIEIIQQEVAAGRALSIDAASLLDVNDFAESRSVPYAWSWALCKFLDSHPRYRDRFRRLSNHLVGREFQRLADSLFIDDKILLAAEWDNFVSRCEYGWEFAANAFVIADDPPAELTTAVEVDVQANQGWQSSGYFVRAGKEYEIAATEQVILDHKSMPWISEPQGISIEYAHGRPLGRLEVAVLIKPNGKEELIQKVFEVQDCGRQRTVRFENDGLLMFHVNDFPSKRSDNQGAYQVTIR